MAHPYVQAWQRLLTGTGTVIGIDTASNGAVTVPTATDNGEVGVSPKIGNLLIGVFVLRAGSVPVFGAPSNGWVVVNDIIADLHVIVCHKIAAPGAGANNFTMSWTGGTEKYWYAAVAEYSGIGALDKFQRSAFNAANVIGVGTSECACGSADIVTSDGGYVISILSIDDETQAGMDVTEAGFFIDYHFDFSNGTTYPGTTLAQSIFASVERNATGTETASWDWTHNKKNVGIILTYGKADGAAVDDWSFNKTTAAQDAYGLGGSDSASTVTADSSGGNYTVIGVPVSAQSAEHTTRWWLKKGSPFVGSVAITLDYDTTPGGGAGATWFTVTNASISPDIFGKYIFSKTVANPRIALKLSNAADKIIVGNAELFLNTDPSRLEGAPHIYTDTAAVTEQVQTEVTYGGVITPDATAAWTPIGENSRVYPMNEGSGTTNAMTETLNSIEGPGDYSSELGWGTTAGWELAARGNKTDTVEILVTALSVTSGTGTLTLTNIVNYDTGTNTLETNKNYRYYIRYSDNVTTGYEKGWGHIVGSTLVRDSVEKSTTGAGQKHNFTAASKHITIIMADSKLGNFANLYADKPPHMPIWGVACGQSNNGWPPYAVGETIMPDNPLILDWSYTSTDETDLDWRVITGTDSYDTVNTDYYADNNDIGLGCPRGSAIFGQSTNQLLAWAKYTQALTGRKVLTTNVWCSNTEIDHPTRGWLYATTGVRDTANCAEHLDRIIGEATAALPAEYAGLQPDIFIFSQGETDARDDKPSATYGWLLYDFLEACRDTTRWGWAKPDMQVYLTDLPELWRRMENNLWCGHRVAKDYYGDRCTLISTQGLLTSDNVHFTGGNANKLGRNIFLASVEPGADASVQALFATRRMMPTVKISPTNNNLITGRVSDSDTAPASGQWRFKATPANGILVHKTQTGFDAYLSGLANLRPGERFFIAALLTQPTVNNYQFVVTGPITYDGTIISIPCSVISTNGTPPIVGSSFNWIWSYYGCWTPADTVAGTDMFFASSQTKVPTSPTHQGTFKAHMAYIDEDGVYRRSWELMPHVYRKHTSGAGTFNLWQSPTMSAGMMYFDVTVIGRVGTTTTQVYLSKFQIFANTAGTATTILYPSGGNGPTPLLDPDSWGACTVVGSASASLFFIRHVGKAAREIEWTTTIQPIEPMVGL